MTRLQKILLLAALYVAQGLPYGFFTQALPVLLREAGLGLPLIGFSGLLTLPWALKFLWAPSVDRMHWPGVGLRKSWLIPLQIASIALYVALSTVSLESSLLTVLIAFLLTNMLAASQDVATDGLAIDLLPPTDRGWGGGLRTIGYRLGMIVGGGALLALYPQIQWSGVMLAMAAISLACTVPVFTFREPQVPHDSLPKKPLGARETAQEIVSFFFRPGARLWIVALFAFKLGHAGADTMLRPWLVDHGYSITDIAWILGTAALTVGLVGALLGGLIATTPEKRPRLLAILGVLQALSVTLYLWPIMTTHAIYKVAIATGLDHFTSGLATTVLFTLMMDACSKHRAASDYSAQACTIVIAQGLAAAVSGVIAGAFGYGYLFAICAGLGFAGALLTWWTISQPRVRQLFASSLAAGLLLLIPLSFAQADDSKDDGVPNTAAIGVHGGAFLPEGIGGVTEVMNAWGARLSMPTSKGVFEIDSFFANGSGASFDNASFDYRLDVKNDAFPAHLLLGVHADEYAPVARPMRFYGGWHFGGGLSAKIAGPISGRADFKYMIGPGISLYVGVGLVYYFPSGSGS